MGGDTDSSIISPFLLCSFHLSIVCVWTSPDLECGRFSPSEVEGLAALEVTFLHLLYTFLSMSEVLAFPRAVAY